MVSPQILLGLAVATPLVLIGLYLVHLDRQLDELEHAAPADPASEPQPIEPADEK